MPHRVSAPRTGGGLGVPAHILPATAEHYAAILALNEESVRVLAPLSRERLEALDACASYHNVAVAGDTVVGFLLAFAHHVDHDSVNFRWFARRSQDYIYVDRIVVSPDHRRLGVGGLLYRDLVASAMRQGYGRITCEIDADPPNPASERFHAGLGFQEVGTQWVEYEPGHPKLVSMRELRLDDALI